MASRFGREPTNMILSMFCTLLMLTVAEAQEKKWTFCDCDPNDNKTIYDFVFPDITESKNISLRDYEGLVRKKMF